VKKLVLLKILLLVICISKVNAQVDPHFSQYYAYPLWLNPALTGVMDGDARITSNLKDQWAGVDNGYRIGAFSGDFRTSDKVALGFNVIDETAGTAGYNYLAAYGSFAYQVPVSSDKYQKLNFGVQAGVINRGFNASKLQLDDQYNPGVGFDPTMPSFENFTNTKATVFDASAGVFYYNGNPQSNANLFLGGSVAHLAPVKDPMATDGFSGRIPMRFTVHGGLRIRASDVLDITPHAIFISQQNSQIRAAGMNLEFKFQSDYSLILGGMYSLNDAAVGNVGFHLGSMLIGVSYDYTTSALQTAVNPQGTYELSISYIFKHHLSNREQVCPRL
jgi:type IX secretion system PorP/SprF family membrane protein